MLETRKIKIRTHGFVKLPYFLEHGFVKLPDSYKFLDALYEYNKNKCRKIASNDLDISRSDSMWYSSYLYKWLATQNDEKRSEVIIPQKDLILYSYFKYKSPAYFRMIGSP
jgi:hypothetical protein